MKGGIKILINAGDHMNRFINEMTFEQSRYKNDDLNNSERFCRETIYHLEKKLAAQPKCLESLYDWIANYHELASIYEQKGVVIMAQKCLLIPHQSMLYMALNYKNDKEWEQIALSAINLTLPKLMKFAAVYPPCELCMKELKSQLALIESNKKTHH